MDVARAFGSEIVLSFALVFVALCVAIGSKERGLMAGIAVGGDGGGLRVGGRAGLPGRHEPGPPASARPSRPLDFDHLWIYVTAPFLGAAFAVGAWTYIYRHPRPSTTPVPK